MAGLASVTNRIQLFATCAVLTMPPPIAARMATTIDSISHGRFGVNIISGWQRREYAQMGIWPGAEHYRRRYDYCAEYVTVMKELWETGRSDFKGDFFQMDDCRCLPMPSAKIPIISAGQSDAGTRYAARYADYYFCSSGGINTPTMVTASVARPVAANQELGGKCGALVLTMIIADETDALQQWRNGSTTKPAPIPKRIAWRDGQASDDPSRDPLGGPQQASDTGHRETADAGGRTGRLLRQHRSDARRIGRRSGRPKVRC